MNLGGFMEKRDFKRWLYIGLLIIFIIVGYLNIKNYYIEKNSLLFSEGDIVTTWLAKRDDVGYDYNYKISDEDVNLLSTKLSKSKRVKSSPKESPPNYLGSIVIYLDGNIKEDKDSTKFQYKRSIVLTKINNEKVYVMLQVNKLIDEGSYTMVEILQRFYIIKSKDIVDCIESLYE
jgi:hypothetical protein